MRRGVCITPQHTKATWSITRLPATDPDSQYGNGGREAEDHTRFVVDSKIFTYDIVNLRYSLDKIIPIIEFRFAYPRFIFFFSYANSWSFVNHSLQYFLAVPSLLTPFVRSSK